jgi:hypothetical protein
MPGAIPGCLLGSGTRTGASSTKVAAALKPPTAGLLETALASAGFIETGSTVATAEPLDVALEADSVLKAASGLGPVLGLGVSGTAARGLVLGALAFQPVFEEAKGEMEGGAAVGAGRAEAVVARGVDDCAGPRIPEPPAAPLSNSSSGSSRCA